MISRIVLNVLVVLLALAAGCTDEPRPPKETTESVANEWHFADIPAPRLFALPPQDNIRLSEVGRFGSEDGKGWLGSIGGIAVSDSVLVVSTPRTCEYVVFSRSRQFLSRFGRCGEGPNEFVSPEAFSLHGDTLIAADLRGTRIRWLTLTGDVLRQVRVPSSMVPSGDFFTFLAPLGDTALVLVAELDSHLRRGGSVTLRDADGRYLRTWVVGRDAETVSLLRDGPGVARENFGYGRTMSLCSATWSTGLRYLMATNSWTDQTVFLDETRLAAGRAEILKNVSLGDIHRDPALDNSVPSRLAPNGLLDVACGRSFAISVHRVWKAKSNETGGPSRATITIFDHNGPVGQLAADPRTPVLMTRLLGAHNNSFFFGSTSAFDFPIIVEMKLSRVGTAGAADSGVVRPR